MKTPAQTITEARQAIEGFLASCTDHSDNHIGGIERLKMEADLESLAGFENHPSYSFETAIVGIGEEFGRRLYPEHWLDLGNKSISHPAIKSVPVPEDKAKYCALGGLVRVTVEFIPRE